MIRRTLSDTSHSTHNTTPLDIPQTEKRTGRRVYDSLLCTSTLERKIRKTESSIQTLTKEIRMLQRSISILQVNPDKATKKLQERKSKLQNKLENKHDRKEALQNIISQRKVKKEQDKQASALRKEQDKQASGIKKELKEVQSSLRTRRAVACLTCCLVEDVERIHELVENEENLKLELENIYKPMSVLEEVSTENLQERRVSSHSVAGRQSISSEETRISFEDVITLAGTFLDEETKSDSINSVAE